MRRLVSAFVFACNKVSFSRSQAYFKVQQKVIAEAGVITCDGSSMGAH